MRVAHLAVLAGLAMTLRVDAAEGEAKKWLVGRWGLAPEKKTEPAAKTATKAKSSVAKRAPAAKPVEESPKCVVEFTKDGKVRLDGDTSVLGDKLRFAKPLAAMMVRVSPETKWVKIDYKFTGDDTIEVSADHSYLLEKLSAGGGAIAPEKAKELDREYRPRETLRVATTPKTLTLTNEQGQALTFHRFTGDSLDVAEGKRREAELRQGMAPLNDILRQQGITTGAPGTGKSSSKKGTRPRSPQ